MGSCHRDHDQRCDDDGFGSPISEAETPVTWLSSGGVMRVYLT